MEDPRFKDTPDEPELPNIEDGLPDPDAARFTVPGKSAREVDDDLECAERAFSDKDIVHEDPGPHEWTTPEEHDRSLAALRETFKAEREKREGS